MRGTLIDTRGILTALAAGGLAVCAFAPAALAEAPRWQLDSRAAPTYLTPGSEAQIQVAALNLGDADANGPITMTDHLPTGLTVVKTSFVTATHTLPSASEASCLPLPETSCTWKSPALPPYERLEMRIIVHVSEGFPEGEENQVAVEGGNAPSATLRQPIIVKSGPTPFGVEKYRLKPENEDGSLDLQAGSHPFQLTTTLDFNQKLAFSGNLGVHPAAPALVKDLHFRLPPGLVGDANPNAPNAVAQCSAVDFTTILYFNSNACPSSAAVGVASVTLFGPTDVIAFDNAIAPVFNLQPAPGEPARFGIEVSGVPIYLDTSVRTGEDYGVTVSVTHASQSVELLGSDVTFWGVPGDPRHDKSRGWQCVLGGYFNEGPNKTCPPLGQAHPSAYLTLPPTCAGQLLTTVEGDSWPTSANPAGSKLEEEFTFPSTLDGCNSLPFNPSMEMQPDQRSASTPTGLKVKVKLPQETTLAASGLAEASVRQTTVTLPEGLLSSPGAAGGLLACSAAAVGFNGLPGLEGQLENNHFSPAQVSCPDAAKVGRVRIRTPLLPNELAGYVYLSEQDTNPFTSPLVLYLIAEDKESGVRVKLAGEVQVNPSSGQLTSVFRNTPPVPFEELQLEFFDGPRATNSTPPYCGTYTAQSTFTPWSGTETAPGVVSGTSSPSASFNIDTGPGGGACTFNGNPLPFAPALHAGSTNNQAGAFTNFVLTISHPDGDQPLRTITMKLPPGLAAKIASVTPCPEPQAATGECGPDSLIGHTTAVSGLGPDPFALPGTLYLTGPYAGAPFGLSAVTPAVAGPFNLGNIVVRSRIEVDPNTAVVTITSNPLPEKIKGVPSQLKALNVSVDRAGFQFNPTNCGPMAITGTLTGYQGASANLISPFEVANCANLPFKPIFTATAGARASKLNGASLIVKVTSGPGQANIAKVKLALPIQLPSRLTTIQKACLDKAFEANPASCPEGSNIGSAIIHTPVLRNPLSGPAYLVSHGNAAFPDVEFVLQGEGIKLILDGKTDIKKGITYSRFESTPDAPFTTFETVLPTGPHSALTANVAAAKNYSLCGEKLALPMTITGQNGAVINQTTKIAISGCKRVSSRAQKLKQALAACRKHKSKKKRLDCARAARRKYGAKTASAKHRRR
jgi:uncharacterized repeat protein (TIGR01451 family)